MATRPGVPIPTGTASSSALWTRLADPETAFDAVCDLLLAGGQDRCSGADRPNRHRRPPGDIQKTDPNGLLGVSLMTLLTGLLA